MTRETLNRGGTIEMTMSASGQKQTFRDCLLNVRFANNNQVHLVHIYLA